VLKERKPRQPKNMKRRPEGRTKDTTPEAETTPAETAEGEGS
jgi:hypothetical protein